jgi:hypothetical protein
MNRKRRRAQAACNRKAPRYLAAAIEEARRSGAPARGGLTHVIIGTKTTALSSMGSANAPAIGHHKPARPGQLVTHN